jgi:acyl carrier protein
MGADVLEGGAVSATEQQLQTIVAQKLKINAAAVPLDRTLLEDLGLDSFDILEVVMEIERTFSPITILGTPAAEELTTLREVAAFIDQASGRA